MAENPHRDIILDSVADGVFTVDMDFIITSFNRAAEKITGVSKDLAIGRKCFDVFHADICQSRCAIRESLEKGKNVVDSKITIINSEGDEIPISVSSAILRNSKGESIGGVETFRDLSSIEILRKKIKNQYNFNDIISHNHEVLKIIDILPDIAASESTVLIEGASGTGKELFARAIHNLSLRKRKKIVAVNCGALPDALLESELFGYVKGAFTDAKKDKPGRFDAAEGGTLFLDEIGDVSAAMQVKLLRVLQEKKYERLGSNKSINSNVRIIAATNRRLMDLIKTGEFREDLYYRLNVVKISLPPLSQRKEDIPLLIEHFIDIFRAKTGKDIRSVSEDAMGILMRHDFPGNIRELENIIEYAFVLCQAGLIEIGHLPHELVSNTILEKVEPVQISGESLVLAEKSAIITALREHRGHRGATATALGINKSTLWRKMKKLQIEFSSHLIA